MLKNFSKWLFIKTHKQELAQINASQRMLRMSIYTPESVLENRHRLSIYLANQAILNRLSLLPRRDNGKKS